MDTRIVVPALASALLFASSALADGDCPPGSLVRSENGFSWCEPTVCDNDGQCKPDEVCRHIAFCMQVGAIAGDAASPDAASKRLVVTQKCAPDKTCPQATTCSDLGRCVSKIAADKMGILTVASAAPASSAPAPAAKSCGCSVIGRRTETSGLIALCALSVLAAARRRGSSRRR